MFNKGGSVHQPSVSMLERVGEGVAPRSCDLCLCTPPHIFPPLYCCDNLPQPPSITHKYTPFVSALKRFSCKIHFIFQAIYSVRFFFHTNWYFYCSNSSYCDLELRFGMFFSLLGNSAFMKTIKRSGIKIR